MRYHLIPWTFLIGRAARAFGIIDPLTVLARLRRFSQPSEVQEPIELLREGIKFHARGLVNTKAIQHNMDWVWPFWVEKQFNPRDPSFIPRAFSFSHVNLTHRNWTAVGFPDRNVYPIVDPRGLVTPLHNGWSIDFWVLPAQGAPLLPSKLAEVDQRLTLSDDLRVETRSRRDDVELSVAAGMREDRGALSLHLDVHARSGSGGRLVAAIRPYNPEGVQFVESIEYRRSRWEWVVDRRHRAALGRRPDRVVFSSYRDGDVLQRLQETDDRDAVHCEVGMATAAAVYDLVPDRRKWLDMSIPLGRRPEAAPPASGWRSFLEGTARVQVPEDRFRFLYEAALRCLVHLSAEEAVPGPFTYRRFWFRDAAFMLAALLDVGLTERCRKQLTRFPKLQRADGFFHSQAGEWDSNGQVLWIFDRFERCTGTLLDDGVLRSVGRAVKWIQAKRLPPERPHGGLLPAGFSAEHLGPNDYYYWDNFWSLAGLEAAARMMRRRDRRDEAAPVEALAAAYRETIFRSIDAVPGRRGRGGVPAAPDRRMDAGAVGSMVADYPLDLVAAADGRWTATMDFLTSHCFHRGAFFQDMIHSGLNAYLTLAIAQSLLRRGNPRYRDLMESVASMASPTGQWPEAVHPLTGGGCMGDGQHGWAAAEWIRMVRSLFVREEGERLIVGSGIFPDWLAPEGTPVGFGPTATFYGPLTVSVTPTPTGASVRLDRAAGGPDVRGEIRLPGFDPVPIVPGRERYDIERSA